MLNIGVLISGGGTNLQAIIDETKSGGINGTVKLVISNKENAYGLERARLSGIKAVYETNEDKIIGLLKENNIDLIITHHPFIFKKMNKINTMDLKGKLIHKLIKNDIALYSMHTILI